jgi:hypothetical protein
MSNGHGVAGIFAKILYQESRAIAFVVSRGFSLALGDLLTLENGIVFWDGEAVHLCQRPRASPQGDCNE